MSVPNFLKPSAKPHILVMQFLRETLAAAAGVEADKRSLRELGELASERRYCDIRDALVSYFDLLIPYRRFGDFQGLATLPRPRPLQLHIEPHIFHGHFRAWLRQQGIDPDRGDIASMSWPNAEIEETERPRRDSGISQDYKTSPHISAP